MKNEIRETYSLEEIEGAWRAYNNAVIQAKLDPANAVFTLVELKDDANVLAGAIVRAKSAPNKLLSFRDIGDALPRIAYWYYRNKELRPQ